MAHSKLSPGLDTITGKLNKKKEVIMRLKIFKNSVTGQPVSYGPQEYYFAEKRNYKTHPRTEAEQIQHDKWQNACRLSSEIRKNPEHPRYAELYQRWQQQLQGQPDSALITNPKKAKVYARFDIFLNVILLREQS